MAGGGEPSPAALEHTRLADARMRSLVEVDQPLVLISQMPRSGGTLLLRLFDGHPDCHVYPLEMGNFLWSDPRTSPEARDWEAVFDRRLLQTLESQGHIQSKLKLHEDRERYPLLIPPLMRRDLFRQIRRRQEASSPRTVLNAYATSFFNAWLDNRNLRSEGSKRWVVAFAPGGVTREESRASFQSLFPDGRGIALVRDPASWYVSARRWSPRWEDRNVAIEAWVEATEAARAWKREREQDVAIVAFDRLIRYTQATAEQISRFLDLELDPAFLHPTINGLQAKANSSFVAKGHDVSRDPLDRGKTLSRADVRWIERKTDLLYKEMRALALPARRPARRRS
jgi:hypothetical protein